MIKLQQIGSNMNVVEAGAYTFLFSYETAVAGINPNIRGGYWRSKDYMPNSDTSKTTERHINKWLASERFASNYEYDCAFEVKVVKQADVNVMLGGINHA